MDGVIGERGADDRWVEAGACPRCDSRRNRDPRAGGRPTLGPLSSTAIRLAEGKEKAPLEDRSGEIVERAQPTLSRRSAVESAASAR
jgi:hypothetical protein